MTASLIHDLNLEATHILALAGKTWISFGEKTELPSNLCATWHCDTTLLLLSWKFVPFPTGLTLPQVWPFELSIDLGRTSCWVKAGTSLIWQTLMLFTSIQLEIGDTETRFGSWTRNLVVVVLAWRFSCCRLSWRTLLAKCSERTTWTVGEGAFKASSEIIAVIFYLFEYTEFGAWTSACGLSFAKSISVFSEVKWLQAEIPIVRLLIYGIMILISSGRAWFLSKSC